MIFPPVRPSVLLSLRPSIRPSVCLVVRPSVRPPICLSVRNAFFKFDEMTFLNEMKHRKEWQRGRSAKEEGATRRKGQQGGKSDLEEGATRRKEQRGGRSDEESKKNWEKIKNGLRTHRWPMTSPVLFFGKAVAVKAVEGSVAKSSREMSDNVAPP